MINDMVRVFLTFPNKEERILFVNFTKSVANILESWEYNK